MPIPEIPEDYQKRKMAVIFRLWYLKLNLIEKLVDGFDGTSSLSDSKHSEIQGKIEYINDLLGNILKL